MLDLVRTVDSIAPLFMIVSGVLLLILPKWMLVIVAGLLILFGVASFYPGLFPNS